MKRLPIVAAGVLSAAIIPRDGWALGLGELTLYSYLNEPFRAEVALLEADALDANDVHVDLASDTEFERLGVSRDFFLTSINFQIESDESGRRVVLTTQAPLREPYLDFVVEARWPDGRLLREYTVLIDLPPRPVVAAPQDTPIEEAAQSDEQAMVSGAETASARVGGYATDAASRPSPGSQYLVTNTDTLWRIASDGAAAGISVEQTMLEIVAANPAAFQAGNINGLKSGYVLQIPEADDIRIDLATALDEVALQNEEWARGVARESQGLTLVVDAKTEAAETSEFVSDETIISDDSALLTEDYADLSDEAPSDVAGASISDELDALMITVSRLQDSIDSLEAQLAERDAELDSLRSALAEQQAATLVPVVVGTPTAPTTQPASVLQAMPLWPFLAGLATLLVGAGLLIWRRLRRNAASVPLDHADLKDAPPAEAIDEASDPSRLSDPQIMASKAVEEAQTYIAYGRTDQAVEVLNDALAEGLTSVGLIMCLLECYVELEQFAEAGALLARLEQGDNPGLLERARQMLLDAGMALTPLDDDADAAEAPAADNVDMDESIYGAETNPVDSKLDLARAYLDMGDEDGARPVLLEVIKEGDLAQRAEARELFLRLEAP